MRFKTLIIAAVLMASVAGMAFAINAQIQESSSPAVQENTVKEDVEKPFRYDPEENKCYAYAWLVVGNGDPFDPNSNAGEEFYIVTTSPDTPYSNEYEFFLVETMEGELTDCVECQYRCSAYYTLCDKYNVIPEDTPVP